MNFDWFTLKTKSVKLLEVAVHVLNGEENRPVGFQMECTFEREDGKIR
jgi:hypothetical protein